MRTEIESSLQYTAVFFSLHFILLYFSVLFRCFSPRNKICESSAELSRSSSETSGVHTPTTRIYVMNNYWFDNTQLSKSNGGKLFRSETINMHIFLVFLDRLREWFNGNYYTTGIFNTGDKHWYLLEIFSKDEKNNRLIDFHMWNTRNNISHGTMH